ncbi:calcium homeostasis modulator protein [Haladaptatus salinisoli]|uniref:calcium homeostasis modulator protein n=1 Tax=Haladaptatus salinisoli TaxID=2884876 RepID=UPI001D0BD861|nr:calcium homeostasis modulator protein [Haladaptatus salinisoli]
MADKQAMYGLWTRELTRYLRSWSQIVGWLATPLLILGFFAFSFLGVALPGLPADVEYVQYLVPVMAGFTILFSASFTGLGILSDRDVGFLKEILVAPVNRRAIVLGWTAGRATTAII